VSDSKILRYEWLKLGRGCEYVVFELDLFGNCVWDIDGLYMSR
jgi:hypothetical protein